MNKFIVFISLISLSVSVIANSPKRVISLSPALTENLFDLGVGKNIVGTTEFSDFPPAAKKIPRVGNYQRPNIEKIISLKPDLVLLTNEGVDQITVRLKKSKIPFVVLDTRVSKTYPSHIKELGELFGKNNRAKHLGNEWKKRLSEIPLPFVEIKTLILLEDSSAIVAGKNTFLDQFVTICGGDNLVKESGYPRLSREKLLSLKPDVLLYMGMTSNKKTLDQIEAKWKARNIRFEKVDPNTFGRLTIRLARNIGTLCRAVTGNPK